MSTKSLNVLKSILDFTVKTKGFDSVMKGVQVVSGGDGSCVCEMRVTEDHQNRGGTLHGGMTATLVDAVSTMALMTTGEGSPGVSVDLSVSYMKACKTGSDIVIDARTQRVGKNLAFLTVDLREKASGQILASGKHTKFIGH